MSRQHSTPLMIGPSGNVHALRPLGLGSDEIRRVNEARIQDLVAMNPECLPIREIDPIFDNPVSICKELGTTAGSVDNFLITTSGLPVLVECKLWRNTESRREVVGQIVDYAKALSQWTASDLHREVNKKSRSIDETLLAQLRRRDSSLDEATFNDAVAHNLRRGRFLLLVVGDGIREGVEEIVEYVQKYSGLHFTLGVVELPLFECPDGSLLVTPRIMARTVSITRLVVSVPESMEVIDPDTVDDTTVEISPITADRIAFWTEFLDGFQLDDPSQPMPRATDNGSLSFMLPAPGGTSWLTVYRNIAKLQIGVFLSYSRNSIGERATIDILGNAQNLLHEVDPSAEIEVGKDGRRLLTVRRSVTSWIAPDAREEAILWLRVKTNEFVNTFRPRMRAALSDLNEGQN